MNIKAFAKSAVALAVVAGSATVANAAVYDLGTVSYAIPTSFVAGAAGSGVGFLDFFAFNLPSNNASGYSVINFPFPALGLDSAITSASLFANPDGIKTGFNGDEGTALKVAASSGNKVQFQFPSTPAGSYWLVVQGFTTGTAGGVYSGSISVTPVPEPESYAMLLAGLGVMGAIAVRRNKAKK